MMADRSEENSKSRTKRLHRLCEKHGFRVKKSRVKTPGRPGYGLYTLIDLRTGHSRDCWSPEEVEAMLTPRKGTKIVPRIRGTRR